MKYVVLLALLWAAPAQAQELDLSTELRLPCAPETALNRSAVLEHEGDAGVWYHLEVMRCMIGRLKALPRMAVELEQWEVRAAGSEALERSLTRRGDLAVEESEVARGALTAAVRARRRAEEDMYVWYRSPILWFAVGMVVTGALVALTAYGLNAAGDL